MKKISFIIMLMALFPMLAKAEMGGIWKSSILWLCPETMQTDANSNLLSWTDRTGKNIMIATVRVTSPNNADCPGTIPTVTPSVLNGYAAMNLDGVVAYEGDHPGVYKTVFILAKPTQAGAVFGLHEDSDVSTHPYFNKTSTGYTLCDGTNTQTATISNETMSLYEIGYGGATYDLLGMNGYNYASGTQKLKRALQQGYPMIGQRVDAFDRAGARTTGQVMEVIAFNDPLTDLQRWHVESYFAFKYGISLAGCTTTSPFTNTLYRRYVTSDLKIAWDGSSSDLSSYYNQMNFVVRDDSAMISVHWAATRNASNSIVYQVANGKSYASPSPLLKDLSYAICGTNQVTNTSVNYFKGLKSKLFYWCWDKKFRFQQQNVPVVSMQVNLSSDQLSLVDASVAGALCYSPTDTLYRKGVYNASTGVLTLDSLPITNQTTIQLVFKTTTCIPISGINPGSVSTMKVGTAVSQTFKVVNVTDTYTYSVASGSLPDGLTLSADGVLSGVPRQKGTFPITIRAVAATGGCSFDKAYTLTVQCPTITLSRTAPGPVNDGGFYSETFSATGGVAPYSFSKLSGTFPVGLSLSQTGVLSGTVASGEGGMYSYVVQAADSAQCTGQTSASMEVVSASCMHVDYATICEGVSYSYRGKNYNTTGVYHDTVPRNGCDSVYVLHLTVNPRYVKTIEASLEDGGSYTLNGKAYNVPGTFRDTLKTVSGCDSIFVLNLSSATSAAQRAYFGLNLYPNPATDRVQIQTGAVPEDFSVELFDAHGRLLRREEWSAHIVHQKNWDIQKIPAGIYFIRFTAGKQVYTERLVKH